jgi:catechol 2,3-dioxygenase-like lactoylglutathione lyase family enzyme
MDTAIRPRLALRVADLARSVAFYRDVIGFAVLEYRPDLDVAVIVDSDGDAILFAGPRVDDLTPYVDDHPFILKPGARLRYLSADLEAQRAALAARGLTDLRIETTAWGDRALEVVDPDGYIISYRAPVAHTPADVLARYARGPDDVEAALAGLSEADLDLARAPDEWTIRQIVHHLVDGDTLQLLPRAKIALTEPGRSFSQDVWDQDVWAAMLYARMPLAPALALLRAARAYVVQLVRQQPDAWNRSVALLRSGGEGRQISIGEMISGLVEHTYEHLEEIQQTRWVHGR